MQVVVCVRLDLDSPLTYGTPCGSEHLAICAERDRVQAAVLDAVASNADLARRRPTLPSQQPNSRFEPREFIPALASPKGRAK